MKGRAVSHENKGEMGDAERYEELLAQHNELSARYDEVASQYENASSQYAKLSAQYDTQPKTSASEDLAPVISNLAAMAGDIDDCRSGMNAKTELLDLQIRDLGDKVSKIGLSLHRIENKFSNLNGRAAQQEQLIKDTKSDMLSDISGKHEFVADLFGKLKILTNRLAYDLEKCNQSTAMHVTVSTSKAVEDVNNSLWSLSGRTEEAFSSLSQRLDEQGEGVKALQTAIKDAGNEKQSASAADRRIEWMLRDMTDHISRLETKLDHLNQNNGATESIGHGINGRIRGPEPLNKDINGHLQALNLDSDLNKRAISALQAPNPVSAHPTADGDAATSVSLNYFDLDDVGTFDGLSDEASIFCERIEAVSMVYGVRLVLEKVSLCLCDLARGWYYYELDDVTRRDLLTAPTVEPFCTALSHRFAPDFTHLDDILQEMSYTFQDAANKRNIVHFAQAILRICKQLRLSPEATLDVLEDRCELPLRAELSHLRDPTNLPEIMRCLQTLQTALYEKYAHYNRPSSPANSVPDMEPSSRHHYTHLPAPLQRNDVESSRNTENPVERPLPGSWSPSPGPSSAHRINSAPQPPQRSTNPFFEEYDPPYASTRRLSGPPDDRPILPPIIEQSEPLQPFPASHEDPFFQQPPTPPSFEDRPPTPRPIPSAEQPVPEYFDDDEGRWFYDAAVNDYFFIPRSQV